MIGNFTKKRFHGIIIVHIIDAMELFEYNRHIKCRVPVLMKSLTVQDRNR